MAVLAEAVNMLNTAHWPLPLAPFVSAFTLQMMLPLSGVTPTQAIIKQTIVPQSVIAF